MSVELKIPEVGESITEVQIGRWLKRVGDLVEAEEGLVEIETDKVSFEIPAPVRGRITGVLKDDGAPATVGEVIGTMEEVAGAEAPPTPPPTPVPAAPSAPAAGTRVMPAARRALAEHGLTDQDVEATGPGGRLLKEDVERRARPGTPVSPASDEAEEEIVPMSPLRRRLAKRLVEAQQTAALLTTFNEIDMGAVKALRLEHGEAFRERHGVKLGFMSFFVKAAVDALKLIPAVNAEVRGEDLVYKNHYDIGVAVGGGKGLVVPVIRNADRLSFADVEKAIADFGARAQTGRLELAELIGGTFTISNGGIYGSLLSTPIVNPPQSGILGLHAIQERPVGRDGQIVLRPMMYVALTYDHRIVDGREAVTFLRRLKDCIENPSRMLIEV